MPSQYVSEQKEFYEDAKTDGGPLTIFRAQAAQIDNSDPSSLVVNTALWKGNDDAATQFQTFAVFFPSRNAVNPYTYCLIPAYNMDFTLVDGMMVKDASNRYFQLSDVNPLDIDGQCVIYYKANLAYKPELRSNG